MYALYIYISVHILLKLILGFIFHIRTLLFSQLYHEIFGFAIEYYLSGFLMADLCIYSFMLFLTIPPQYIVTNRRIPYRLMYHSVYLLTIRILINFYF